MRQNLGTLFLIPGPSAPFGFWAESPSVLCQPGELCERGGVTGERPAQLLEARARGTAEAQLTGGKVPVVIDDRMEEVRLPGVFRVPHRPVIKEHVLVRAREVSAVLHVDDEEPMPGLPSCDRLQLGQHLHGELLQILKCRGVPGDNGGVTLSAAAELRGACVGVCACLSYSARPLVTPTHLTLPLLSQLSPGLHWDRFQKTLSNLKRIWGKSDPGRENSNRKALGGSDCLGVFEGQEGGPYG